MYEEGANLKVFTHSINEIEGILYAAINVVENKQYQFSQYGDTIKYLFDNGYSSSDILLIINNLQKNIESLRVTLCEPPSYSIDLGVDETLLEKLLKEKVGYRRREALIHDKESLTAIFRLRKGKKKNKIEECDAVFITMNNLLSHISTEFFKSYHDIPFIPIAILDHVLASIAWVKKPIKAQNLHLKMLFADCYVALNPSDELWKKYLDEVNNKKQKSDISDDACLQLRFSIEARQTLMEITKGEVDNLSGNTIDEILEKLRKDQRTQFDVELTGEKDKRLEVERKYLKEIDIRDKEINKIKLQKQEQINNIKNISNNLGLWTSKYIFYVIAIFFCLLTVISFHKKPELYNKLSLIWSVLTILSLFLNFTLKSVKRKIEIWISNKFEIIILKLIKIKSDE